LLAKYFKKGTEMNKEHQLYHILMKEENITEHKANRIIDTIIDARKKLNEIKLKKEKYELIREIQKNYVIEDFFKSPIKEYKILASIYKLFENVTSTELYRPIDVINAKNTLIENFTNKKPTPGKVAGLLEVFSTQDEDVRLLTYKIMLDSFNRKYKKLDSKQKNLLREYIYNVSNTNKFREFVNIEVDSIKSTLKELSPKVNDKVTLIKLQETISQLDTVRRGAIVKDNQLAALMLSYELIKEIKNVTK
jgi:hypothetical protein